MTANGAARPWSACSSVRFARSAKWVLPNVQALAQLRVGCSAGAGPFLGAKREEVSGTGGVLFPSAHDPTADEVSMLHRVWRAGNTSDRWA
jgi:hypothetical protein